MILVLLLGTSLASENYPLPYYYGTKYKDFDLSDNTTKAFYWSYQYHLAADTTLWIADNTRSRVLQIADTSDLPRGSVTLVTGQGEPGFEDGDLSSAFVNQPNALTTYTDPSTSASYVFLADTYNHCIRRLDLEAYQIWEFAGKCETAGFKDGFPPDNRLNLPTLIGYDLDDTLLVYDSGNRYIRVINITSGEMTTLINGACRSSDEIELGEGESIPSPPYSLPQSYENYGFKIYLMACVKSMVKTSGEPSEHLVDENEETDCIKHDIMCGDRTHPLVAKEYV